MAFPEMKLFQATPGALVKLESLQGVRSLQKDTLPGNGGEHAKAGMTQVNKINCIRATAQTLAEALAQSLQLSQTLRAGRLVPGEGNGKVPIACILSFSSPAAEEKGEAHLWFTRK
jgi:hypothetical protein